MSSAPAPTAARALRRDAAENRRRLLRAAWEVFAEHGADAGVDEIARRAGVGTGTLYRRFATKDDLVAALADELYDEMLERTTRIVEEQPGGRGLAACLQSMGEEMASHRGCLTLLWRAFPIAADPRRARFWGLVGRLLEQARDAGEVRDDLTLTDVYLCVVSLRTLIDETADRAPDAWRRQLALLLAGFRPSGGPLPHPPADDSLVETGIPFRPVCR